MFYGVRAMVIFGLSRLKVVDTLALWGHRHYFDCTILGCPIIEADSSDTNIPKAI